MNGVIFTGFLTAFARNAGLGAGFPRGLCLIRVKAQNNYIGGFWNHLNAAARARGYAHLARGTLLLVYDSNAVLHFDRVKLTHRLAITQTEA